MMEIWKDIQDYEGLYQVSNYGAVRSIDRTVRFGRKLKGKILSQSVEKDGYFVVNLSKNGKTKSFRVHRLVAMAFITNANGYKEINHKDEKKQNNCVENLEWCDTKYNINYGERNNLVSRALSGEKSYNHKLTNVQVEEIRKTYKRRSKDFNMQKLSKKYGVSLTHISRIINNQRWKENKED